MIGDDADLALMPDLIASPAGVTGPAVCGSGEDKQVEELRGVDHRPTATPAETTKQGNSGLARKRLLFALKPG
jgi:hypothetical protein